MRRNLLNVFVALAFWTPLGGSDEPVKKEVPQAEKDLAKLNIQILEKGVKTYVIRYDKFPAKLAEVVAFIDPAKRTLQDPWGKDYKYEAKVENNGETVIKIWTVAPGGTRIDNARTVPPDKPAKMEPTQSEKDAAKVAASNLEKAVKTYFIKHGEFPKKLEDLIKPPDGGKPFIDDKKALQDPWGKDYQFKTEEENGEIVIRIWTIAPDGTRIDNRKKK